MGHDLGRCTKSWLYTLFSNYIVLAVACRIENEYAIIIGADNLKNYHKWKNYTQILDNYSVYVYPRPGVEIKERHKNIYVVKGVPQMEISASFIRNSIKLGKNVSYLIPEKAWKYIDEMNFYKK